ncbi:hypothetical protein B296_00037132 [Ensete ventricosum]|uniref:Uncharacterized protein n=1 Tax=Ensete ventricosum TaxID=4639 RepID=A0A426YBJ3_ENSVE|nr:hypothetical protein B296_00037132 [Ensete ventricosum]
MASPRVADPCGLVVGGCCPYGLVVGEQPLAGWPLAIAPCGRCPKADHPYGRRAVSGRAGMRLPPLRAGRNWPPHMQGPLARASRPFAGGLGHNQLHPCKWPGRGWPPL